MHGENAWSFSLCPHIHSVFPNSSNSALASVSQSGRALSRGSPFRAPLEAFIPIRLFGSCPALISFPPESTYQLTEESPTGADQLYPRTWSCRASSILQKVKVRCRDISHPTPHFFYFLQKKCPFINLLPITVNPWGVQDYMDSVSHTLEGFSRIWQEPPWAASCHLSPGPSAAVLSAPGVAVCSLPEPVSTSLP